MMKKQLLLLMTLPLLLTSCYRYNSSKDISYGKYGERNLLDISFPNKKTSSLIVYIHGGGWIGGSKSNYAEDFANKYKDGYVYAAINYRYASNEYHCDDILDDIQRAMLKIKDVCKDNGYNINKVAFFGHSAGGHLSLQYAYKMKDVCPFEVSFVSSLSGPTDLTDKNYITNTIIGNTYYELMTYMTGIEINEANFDSYIDELLKHSPVNYVDKACPTIICHGESDTVVPLSNALTLKEKLASKNVSHEFFLYGGGSGHALENDKKAERQYEQKFKEYKTKYLN